MPTSPRQDRLHRRAGNTATFAIGAMAVVAAMAFGGWWMFGRGGDEEMEELITTDVTTGPYDFVVIEQGQVESATNTELRCEVRSRGGGGGGGSSGGMGAGSTTILDVAPEGTIVEEGDVVVKLDSSNLEQERNTQLITVAGREAAVVQAENTVAAAKISRNEYLLGTFVQNEKLIQGEVFVAEQNLRTAQQNLNSAKTLQAKGIITALQVETSQYNVDNAQKQLEVAQTKLDALRLYTKEKMLKDIDSAIATAEANLAAQQSSLALEKDKLSDIEDQIEKCTIKAPQKGQVVYANESDSWRGSSSSSFVVIPGASVRERQVIIRLPNMNDMQVKATVNEAKVTLVRPGLPVTIRVDALRDEIIEGVVTKVNPYAEPQSFSSGNIRKYATVIKILNPPEGLRSGMNAEVRIHVERKSEALQVPVQALAEHKGHFFSIVQKADGDYETREVFISSTNDKVATIERGLSHGDTVVMNPRGAGGLLALPNLPDPSPANLADVKRTEGTPISLNAPAGGPPPGAGPGGGPGGPGGGKGKKGGFMTPDQMVAQYLESDNDKDDKLSKDELATMDDRRKQALATADKDGDGFLNRSELQVAAVARSAAMQQKMRERTNEAGGPGGRGGRGGEGGGFPAGAGE
jgi:HlyD family secretion protein